METKHTPGPWTIDRLMSDDGTENEITVCADHGDAIAVIALERHYDAQAQANARLIAAAPDLLAAADALFGNASPRSSSYPNGAVKTYDVPREHMDALRAAIAKATGGQDAPVEATRTLSRAALLDAAREGAELGEGDGQ